MKEKLIGKKYLPHRTVIGFVLGIIAGLLFKDFSVWVLPFGTAFMNLIKMLIVPVIFFSLVSVALFIKHAQMLAQQLKSLSHEGGAQSRVL